MSVLGISRGSLDKIGNFGNSAAIPAFARPLPSDATESHFPIGSTRGPELILIARRPDTGSGRDQGDW
jgi:hypothetical protein